MYYLIVFSLCIVLIEAITNLLVKSELFLPMRKYLFESNSKTFKFIGRVLDCPYCTSVWVAVFCVGMLYLFIMEMLPILLTLFFFSIILHRCSNVVHHVVDRIDSHHESGQGS